MSRDIRQYWRDVRTIEAGLPEFVSLVGVRDAAVSTVTEAPAAVAARLLRAKSHRRATDDEVISHQAREREANRTAREERMRKDGASLVVVR